MELGDGFIGAGSVSAARFLEEVRTLRALLEERGRDPATFAIGKRVYVSRVLGSPRVLTGSRSS